ncbi:MAG TPA: hypothetical protein VGK90_06365 [Rhizomicrobium sp.]
MRILYFTSLVCALALAGCAEDLPSVKWSKPGATYDQFVQDRAACVAEERQQSRPFYVGGARYAGRPDALDSGIFIPCMTSRGYHEDPKGYAAPSGDFWPLSP